MQRVFALLFASLALALGSAGAHAASATDRRLEDSRRVFESFSYLTEQSIPTWLLERAYGVVVVPRVIKGALIIGGRGGRGVMAVRNPDGSWSYPVFVTLAGANVGFQWGVQSTDLVLVLMSRRSVEGIAGGKVTLGADASVAAGPIGRSAAAATDATFSAQVSSRRRSSRATWRTRRRARVPSPRRSPARPAARRQRPPRAGRPHRPRPTPHSRRRPRRARRASRWKTRLRARRRHSNPPAPQRCASSRCRQPASAGLGAPPRRARPRCAGRP